MGGKLKAEKRGGFGKPKKSAGAIIYRFIYSRDGIAFPAAKKKIIN